MGSCLGTPVNNHSSSPITTKPSTPETSRNNSNRNGSDYKVFSENGSITSGGGDGETTIPNLKTFTLTELKSATRNFKPNTVLGEGGFGRVFKGWIDETTLLPVKVGTGIPVAVKKSSPDSSQGHEEWEAEVKFLGKFSHPNLVKLLGFCREESQYLLVYEYMQKGSLEKHLFRKGAEPLPWGTRLKVAIGAAKGLTFLHTSEKSVIYRDFKTSNILLDGSFNAKLSDFGLAKLGPINGNSHVTTRIMGTYGYAAPEYVNTGHLYVKSDVYGFGVVLLELLTGLKALDSLRPSYQHNLVLWANPSLRNKKKLVKIIDPNLAGKYPVTAAMLTADLILTCLEHEPRNRPSMEAVLGSLIEIAAIVDKPTKKESKSKAQKGKAHDQRSALHSKKGPAHYSQGR